MCLGSLCSIFFGDQSWTYSAYLDNWSSSESTHWICLYYCHMGFRTFRMLHKEDTDPETSHEILNLANKNEYRPFRKTKCAHEHLKPESREHQVKRSSERAPDSWTRQCELPGVEDSSPEDSVEPDGMVFRLAGMRGYVDHD